VHAYSMRPCLWAATDDYTYTCYWLEIVRERLFVDSNDFEWNLMRRVIYSCAHKLYIVMHIVLPSYSCSHASLTPII